jgi:hypothetical protein
MTSRMNLRNSCRIFRSLLTGNIILTDPINIKNDSSGYHSLTSLLTAKKKDEHEKLIKAKHTHCRHLLLHNYESSYKEFFEPTFRALTKKSLIKAKV